MGNLSKFVESRKVGFNHQSVLTPTTPSAITPFEQLNLQSYQAFPDVPHHGLLPEDLCDRVDAEYPTLMKRFKRSVGVLGKLLNISKAQTDLHVAHRNYQKQLADEELAKKTADVSLGSHLIRQTARYEALRQKLILASSTTEARISKTQQQYQQRFDEYLSKLQSGK